jgi:hypothetical protein
LAFQAIRDSPALLVDLCHREQAVTTSQRGSKLAPLPPGGEGLSERIAAKTALDFTIPGCTCMRLAAEPIRDWLQAYRRGDLDALLPKPGRPPPLPGIFPCISQATILICEDDTARRPLEG